MGSGLPAARRHRAALTRPEHCAEALYFNTREDSDRDRLDGSLEYTLTFPPALQPPVDAFWSITMYDAQDFLAENPIDRYSIGNPLPPTSTANPTAR